MLDYPSNWLLIAQLLTAQGRPYLKKQVNPVGNVFERIKL